MLTHTNTKNYEPSAYDLEPARISKIEADHFVECLEHQARVAAAADFFSAVADVEAGIAEDLETIRKIRELIGA